MTVTILEQLGIFLFKDSFKLFAKDSEIKLEMGFKARSPGKSRQTMQNPLSDSIKTEMNPIHKTSAYTIYERSM